MGRNKKNKNKQKQATVVAEAAKEDAPLDTNDANKKGLAEADAAAGSMLVDSSSSKNSPSGTKRSLEDDDDDKVKQKEEVKLTRKQKRQKLNEKNKWPQQPKVINPEARAKAYLRVAGIEAVKEDHDPTEQQPEEEMIEEKMKNEDQDAEWRRFGRFLGASEARTRHKAVKRLSQYLRAKSGFGLEDASDVVGLSELDLLKLWKGLWFTLYMADKVPVQDELAKHIAKLMWCLAGPVEEDIMAGQAYLDMEMEQQMALEEAAQQQKQEEEMDDDEDEEDDDDEDETPTIHWKRNKKKKSGDKEEEEDDSEDEAEDDDNDSDAMDEDNDDEEDQDHKHIRGAPLAQLMIRTFFRTLVREWGNMDKYRVDKFYTLIRYILAEVYRYMAKRQWSLGIIKLFNDAIAEEALMQQPNGVRFHLIDIALEELTKVIHRGDKKSPYLPVTEAIFLEIMEPFFCMAAHGFGDRIVQARAVEKVLEKFLMEFSLVSPPKDDDDESTKRIILDQVHVSTVSKFIFEMASDESTPESNRKSLYDMHKTYERQRTKMGTDLQLNSCFDKEAGEEEVEEDGSDADYLEEQIMEEDDDDLKYLGFVKESDDDDDEDDDAQQSTKAAEKTAAGEKKKKKKKGKKKGNDDEENQGMAKAQEPTDVKLQKRKGKKLDEMDITQHGGDDADDKKKRKKRKKDKKKADKSEELDGGEDVLTITMSDQKAAKEALNTQEEFAEDNDNSSGQGSKKKNKKKSKKDDDSADEGDGDTKTKKKKKLKRRVSFDKHNQARSWKASMDGLRTLDPSEAASKTPEKSILLNKDKKSPINKSAKKKGRKRAVDYF
ncbi:RNA processing protein 1 homolog B [Seminavis robusta]|uniref:RNA processing protein 1 homolog B n=1 Tax=Seminavis robusta TaxID=568900 RepID=A0A9N8E2E8_9STRA|nr:RNA processing protein 1 homolog B [Seminavis robusta]|eukprot:Sro550_g164740.1 RNA processing protein 1 homolog B (828) ;mRNA; r:40451-42934